MKREIPNQLKKQLKQLGAGNVEPKWRCNRINQAFYIFLYRNRTLLGKKLKIADRLDYIRNPVMHGELNDPSSEARFSNVFYYVV